ncbi:MAG: hypothetical protein ABI599_15010 [Flavobacteriales bacterium]
MNRWLAILFMSTYLCSATELHQLFKLPALFAHFAEDLGERPNEGFMCFLADHYFDGMHREAEGHEDHGDLPFHNQQDCTSHSLQVIAPSLYGELVVNIPSSPAEPHALDASSYSFLLSRDVWQPPKA